MMIARSIILLSIILLLLERGDHHALGRNSPIDVETARFRSAQLRYEKRAMYETNRMMDNKIILRATSFCLADSNRTLATPATIPAIQ